LDRGKFAADMLELATVVIVNSPRESVGICIYRHWFVCLSVTTITKKILDGFVPNFMERFLGGKG